MVTIISRLEINHELTICVLPPSPKSAHLIRTPISVKASSYPAVTFALPSLPCPVANTRVPRDLPIYYPGIKV